MKSQGKKIRHNIEDQRHEYLLNFNAKKNLLRMLKLTRNLQRMRGIIKTTK